MRAHIEKWISWAGLSRISFLGKQISTTQISKNVMCFNAILTRRGYTDTRVHMNSCLTKDINLKEILLL